MQPQGGAERGGQTGRGAPTQGLEKPLSLPSLLLPSRVGPNGFGTQVEILAGRDELGVTSLLVAVSLRVRPFSAGPANPWGGGSCGLLFLAPTVPSTAPGKQHANVL